ncbi:abortive infection system antitoxin AbiGi family protein [Neisseria chenwenguii]|uniref:abortive infection system antitoxin AbiGi family protein n=1 Tax=Neisseria chenwenguii TaxID=1853278 RepID=UPI000F502A24|nr:abortive infection system antitoxin AbiGi family protein [Neisseria chenwenguii]ROV55425.1 hypothetical protein EGS38_09490 [Neisseria chenwenguii]
MTNHTDFYGKYGIGLTKEWGINQRLNPIWYISEKSGFSDTLWKNLFQGGFLALLNLLCGSEKIDLNTLPFLRFIKPLKGKMKKNGKLVQKDFDEECEWRYSPVSADQSFLSILSVLATQNQEELESNNQILKQKASLKFEPSDIKYIFVPEDKDIPYFISNINKIFRKRGYEDNEIYLLSSKVISLQTIREDF